ncbi:MAG: DUF2188 domain-containing protein [Pseudonocardia sp.]|nr:DUF2188 domain-containing protein [Pseudonocardia sp.]
MVWQRRFAVPRATNTAATKAEAQAAGRELAIDRGVEHIVHNQDGKKSRDPRSSKG